MAVYTSYDMIADCQADRSEGWIHLVRTFVPPLRIITRHYGGSEETLAAMLDRLRAGGAPIHGMRPCHEREFLYQLRPLLLELTAPPATPGVEPDLETVTQALAPLTATERQVAWFDSFGYDSAQTAVIMRMAPETTEKIRSRASEMLRGALDSWSASLLRDHGRALGAELEKQLPAEPLEFRHFLDVFDGRITWQRKKGFDNALMESWSEVHKACRIRESDAALSDAKPLADVDTYLNRMGVRPPKPSFWKSIFAAR